MTVAFVTGGSGFIGSRLIRALRARGDAVYGLARTLEAAERIERAGAEAWRGGLEDPGVLRDGMRGADLVFHVAHCAAEWGRPAEFERVNVEGTTNVLWAMEQARVDRVVHLSTAWVLSQGRPLMDVDEHAEPPSKAYGWVHRSMLDAEREVLASTAQGLEPIVVRPGFVWGPGDTVWLPRLRDSIGSGRFRWIGHGRHRVSTTHVANLVRGLVLAGDRGRTGRVYFVTDGPPVEFRELATRYLKTVGITPRGGSITPRGAKFVAMTTEGIWNLMNVRRPPALPRTVVAVAGLECTVRDDLARAEIGYESVIDLDRGMEELAAARKKRSPQG